MKALTTDQWKTAKQMYFSDIPVTDIAEELDLDLQQLGIRIFGADKTGYDPDCWFQQRKKANPRSFVTYQHVKPYLLSMAESRLSKMIIEGVQRMDEEGGIEEIDDLDKAVTIVTKLDKLGRLERGEATEHVSVDHGFTLRDIQNGVRMVDNENEENTDGEEKINKTREAIETSCRPTGRSEEE